MPRTPGPWYVSQARVGCFAVYAKGDKSEPICFFGMGTDESLTQFRNARENAVFVAAGPRLAQALRTLVEALPEDGEWGHFIDIKNEARAALAQAEG